MNCIRAVLAIACLCRALPALAQSPKLADGKPRQFSRDIRLTDVRDHKGGIRAIELPEGRCAFTIEKL